MMEVREVAVCVFEDPEAARDAMKELQAAGFSGEDVSVLSPNERHDKGARAREGAAAGAVVGGLFGGQASPPLSAASRFPHTRRVAVCPTGAAPTAAPAVPSAL